MRTHSAILAGNRQQAKTVWVDVKCSTHLKCAAGAACKFPKIPILSTGKGRHVCYGDCGKHLHGQCGDQHGSNEMHRICIMTRFRRHSFLPASGGVSRRATCLVVVHAAVPIILFIYSFILLFFSFYPSFHPSFILLILLLILPARGSSS